MHLHLHLHLQVVTSLSSCLEPRRSARTCTLARAVINCQTGEQCSLNTTHNTVHLQTVQLITVQLDTEHCTTEHCTTEYYTTEHCTTEHCTTDNCTTEHCTTKHCTMNTTKGHSITKHWTTEHLHSRCWWNTEKQCKEKQSTVGINTSEEGSSGAAKDPPTQVGWVELL